MDVYHGFPVFGGFSEWQDRYRGLADISCAEMVPPSIDCLSPSESECCPKAVLSRCWERQGAKDSLLFPSFGPNLTKAKWLSQRMWAMEDLEPERALGGIQFGSISHPFSL